jgi:hypothetical protein
MPRKKKCNPATHNIATPSKPLPFITIFNYAFLAVLISSISAVFFPRPIQMHMETIVWDYPLIPISGILLTALFLMLNRHAVIYSFSETDANQSGADLPDRSNPIKFRLIPVFSGYYMILIIVLSLMAFMLYAHRLDSLNFWDDEFLVLKAAEGYRQTGTYYFWNFVREEITQQKYQRAWPHLWLVAQAYGLFGVSEWSSRIVSVGFGCLFIFSSFFVVLYFTNHALLAMIVSAVFLFNPDFIYYFRYNRMYAIVIPLFFLWSMTVFQAMEGRWPRLERRWGKSVFFSNYLNFDYRFALLSLVLLFWAYHIHVNSLLIVLVAFLYLFIMAVAVREKKYIGLAVFLIIAAILIYVFLPKITILKYTMAFVSFFESIKPIFLKLMVQKPFSALANLMLLSGSMVILFFCPDKLKRKKLLFCLLFVLVAIVFFMFMVDFHSQHYRYICHVVPFAILMICLTYVTILRVFQTRYILILGVLLLLASQTTHFVRGMPPLYYGALGQPWPSVAYATVRDNLADGDVIFAQYLRDYYMRGIPKDTPIFSLGQVRQDSAGPNPYNFERFFSDIRQYKRGWVIWKKYKEYHVHPQVAAYVKTLFQKIHGEGVDDTNVEVYFFDESMVKRATFR